MLKRLHIENYALIEQLDLRLEDGFTVITGETGAGKSILLGAIALLLGGRADSHSILNGAEKCVVEAEFDRYHILREVHTSGRSKASVNGKSVTVGELKALGEKLIDIHSQHQNLLLPTAGAGHAGRRGSESLHAGIRTVYGSTAKAQRGQSRHAPQSGG